MYDRRRTARAVMRWLLATFFIAAGYTHITAPNALLAITPDWVPFAPQVIIWAALHAGEVIDWPFRKR